MSKILHLSGKNSICKCGLPIEDTPEEETVVYTEQQLKREIALYSNPKLCYLCSTEFIKVFSNNH